MKLIVVLGRLLFSFIFLGTIFSHFSAKTIDYAASAGVPAASFFVPLSGVIATIGALCIIFGFKARFGGWLIILFLIPVTLYMHRFWTVTDPMMHQMQMVNFLKNLSLMGGALLITYFGAGPVSIDNRMNKETKKIFNKV
jgi:putative oxidoreductase